jgi:signal recognition particle GTPase
VPRLEAQIPRNWLNSIRLAEISHCADCNFSIICEFKYIGDSDRSRKRNDPNGLQIRRVRRVGSGSGTRGKL